jgi:serine/threonine protein kinase/Flp pilus assembly protein TadD
MSQRISDQGLVPRQEATVSAVPPSRSRPGSHPLRRSGGKAPRLPLAGDELFGFRLRRELGRGAFACVYLAEQADLAGRPVVLKVSGLGGNEPQTLAQLQHTHIVPIHSVHEDAQTRLRAVCMPYFGGASLSRVLQVLWSGGRRPAQGQELVRALAEAQKVAAADSPPSATSRKGQTAAGGNPAPSTPPPTASAPNAPEAAPADGRLAPTGPTPLALLAGMSYTRAAVWVVARLAEALEHAHQRGVLHRDIKPSNILLSADGQPMLLDFNLAQDVRNGQAQATAVLGGTVAFMAPEHLRALAARDLGLGGLVDQRADIYSLGMVLYEMLAGQSPFDQGGSYSPLVPLIQAMALERGRSAPSLRQKRPDLPWGLESIVRKCLAPLPAQRYQRAEHLAEDLRRFLEDRPLKHAPELSRVERVQKWLRRHPRLTSSGSVAAAAALLLALAGAGLVGARQHLINAREQLAVLQAEERKRAYESGTVRALCLVNTKSELQDHLPLGQAVCEHTPGLYGVLDRDDWQANPDWQRLAPDDRRRLAEDTRELLLLLAWARARTAPEGGDGPARALALLARAEAIDGLPPSRALWEDRAAYLEQAGDAAAARDARARAAQIEPSGFRDHYLLATSYARAGRYADAVTELNVALDLNPQHYWSWVQRGICHQELGRDTLAAGDFGASIGLWPDFAWGYFNRGYVLGRSGHKEEAVADYTAALKRDPGFLLAYVNRGLALVELKQYERALADFDKAVALGRDDAFVHAGRGMALEGLGRPAEADAAFAAAFARAGSVPEEARTRLRWTYGFAVSARLPCQAEAAFEEVLRAHPDQPQALYGRAMLLVEEGQEAEALALFGRAVEADPGCVEARRARAILLARRGDFDGASRDINWCLEREPAAGATLYAAACVAARAVDKAADASAARQASGQALAFLGKAFAHGYGRDRAGRDPDLAALQNDAQFRQLLEPADQRARGEPLR